MTEIYPRVLIVGQYFNTNSGGGITMSNLFDGWDKEKIAVAAENKSQFPFNLNKLGLHRKSGLLNKNEQTVASFAFHGSKKKSYKSFYENFLSYTGLRHYRHRYEISNQFLNWIEQFSPDIIYSQLS